MIIRCYSGAPLAGHTRGSSRAQYLHKERRHFTGKGSCAYVVEGVLSSRVAVMRSPRPPIEVPYRDVRWRRTRWYSCQINPITITSKTVNTMRPTPCVYEKR